jgi:hypothetical protein
VNTKKYSGDGRSGASVSGNGAKLGNRVGRFTGGCSFLSPAARGMRL